MSWIHLAQNEVLGKALVNTVVNFQVPEKVGDFLTSSVTVIFSKNDSTPWGCLAQMKNNRIEYVLF
jgi:hypothetical protein